MKSTKTERIIFVYNILFTLVLLISPIVIIIRIFLGKEDPNSQTLCCLIDVPSDHGSAILEALETTALPDGVSIVSCPTLPTLLLISQLPISYKHFNPHEAEPSWDILIGKYPNPNPDPHPDWGTGTVLVETLMEVVLRGSVDG